MNRVTAVLISFLRPGYTEACVRSLADTYPGINIIVAENAEYNKDTAEICRQYNAKYVVLPYDSGVCVARNRLVQLVETEYVLVGDDDFFYTPEARVDEMAAFLDGHPEFDTIGGRVKQDGVIRNYQGYIHERPRSIHLEPLDLETGFLFDDKTTLLYKKADLTFNYFLARTEKVKKTPWDENIKVAYEHLTWFIDFKKDGGKVAFSPDPVVIHKPQHIDPKQESEYPAFRNRRCDKERFFKKYDIDYTVTMNGTRDFAPYHAAVTKKNDIKYVDFCITTFLRPKALERLLFSIARFYPMANIYIADQNEIFDRTFYKRIREELYNAGLQKRMSIEHLPYDCGLSYARNHLVTTTPNKYKLILDDDMVFTEGTDIGKFVKLMDVQNAGVVGGIVVQNGHEIHFEFTPEKRGDTIVHVEEKPNWLTHDGVRYRKTGCVLNFALFRKELFNVIRWDNDLKVTEHLDFYMRMKGTTYSILYTPDVMIDHPPTERENNYKQMRQRDEFQAIMLRKHNARRVKYTNGQVVELMPDGSLKRYKEHG